MFCVVEQALAIVDQMGASGEFTDVVLTVTIVMDVLVIVLFDINALIAQSLLDDDHSSAAYLLGSLVVSFAIAFVGGTAFGFVLRRVVFWESCCQKGSKWASVEPLMRVSLLLAIGLGCFLVYHATEPWFEPLVFLMVASATLRNLTPCGFELQSLLKKYSPYVYVPFFTLSGASINLEVRAGQMRKTTPLIQSALPPLSVI